MPAPKEPEHECLPWGSCFECDLRRDAMRDESSAEAELTALRSQIEGLRTALQRMVDWSDCQCEHDGPECCAHVPDISFHCPGCIAAHALSLLLPGVRQEETKEPE